MAKTIKVAAFVAEVNNALDNAYWSAEQRIAIAYVASNVLMSAKAYKGFTYLDLPFEKGVTDETRIAYFV